MQGITNAVPFPDLTGKQDTLYDTNTKGSEHNANIKTIGGQSLLDGINPSTPSTENIPMKTINNTALIGSSGNISLQVPLVSGTNIKTVNNTTLLGSGNVAVQETLVSGTNLKKLLYDDNSTTESLLGSGNTVAIQRRLVSGSNIKKINGNDLPGSGAITIALKSVDYTLTTSWSLGSDNYYYQTWTPGGGVTETTNGTFSLAMSATKAQVDAALAAQLRVTSQTGGVLTIKCYGTKPTITIPCTLVYL